jgi:hypothetical protein
MICMKKTKAYAGIITNLEELAANILSMCKGLDYVVDRKLYVHSHLDDEHVEYKGVPNNRLHGRAGCLDH